MSIRDDFEQWVMQNGHTTKLRDDPASPDTYFSYEVEQKWIEWQAAAAHYEAERNSLLAVIADKDKALRACDEAMDYMSEYDIPITLPHQVKEALSLTTDTVRLVEAGVVETVGGYPDTSQQLCYLKKYTDNGTKLYIIEVKGE